jgi:THO complex subunit 1
MLMNETRRRVPSVESFREELEKEYENLKDAMFPSDIEECNNTIQTKTWKGLRLASQNRFHLFNKLDDKFDESRNDFKTLCEIEEKLNEDVRARTNLHIQQGQTPATPAT